MTAHDVYLVSPQLAMAVLGILVIVLDLVVSRKSLVLGLAFLGLAAPVVLGLVLLFDLNGSGFNDLVPDSSVLAPSLSVDQFSLFFNFLLIAATALVILVSTDYVQRMERNQGEYFGLILLSATGMMLMVAATELITIYISLELTTLPLAGVMLKMGGYGLLRINVGMFPEQVHIFAWVLMALGVFSVLYGAVVTLRQTDLKRLIAYSSVSHMGLVLVGIGSVGIVAGEVTATGLSGAAMQLFTHGTITGLLFLVVGLIYERTHTRYIPDLGGLANRMPLVTVAFLIAGFASLGLPGLSGFVSEILVFFGAFGAFPWATVLAVLGIILAAGYILWMIQRTLFGSRREQFDNLSDASFVEALPLVLMVIAIIAVGVYPAFLTEVFSAGLEPMVDVINRTIEGQLAVGR